MYITNCVYSTFAIFPKLIPNIEGMGRGEKKKTKLWKTTSQVLFIHRTKRANNSYKMHKYYAPHHPIFRILSTICYNTSTIVIILV